MIQAIKEFFTFKSEEKLKDEFCDHVGKCLEPKIMERIKRLDESLNNSVQAMGGRLNREMGESISKNHDENVKLIKTQTIDPVYERIATALEEIAKK